MRRKLSTEQKYAVKVLKHALQYKGLMSIEMQSHVDQMTRMYAEYGAHSCFDDDRMQQLVEIQDHLLIEV